MILTETEVAEALALLVQQAGYRLPDVGEVHCQVEDYLDDLLRALAKYRAAVARDAAADTGCARLALVSEAAEPHEHTTIKTTEDGQVIEGVTGCRVVIRHHDVVLRDINIQCPEILP